MRRFVTYLPKEREDELKRIARALVAPGKGILAVDESSASMSKRLDMIKMENNEENRRKFRQMLLCAGPAMSEHIGGVIMFHETLYQNSDDGIPFVKHLQQNGIVPGIKVDTGTSILAGTEGEMTTQGIDGLAERCVKYKKEGAHFAKWRSTYKIQPHTPSYQAMVENANLLARFASICQQNRLVPIVETEVLPDGDHDLDTARNIALEMLNHVFYALNVHHIFLEGILFKTNMITPGFKCTKRATVEEIALATVQTLQRRVPPAVPGILFLSSGQPEEEATSNLNAMNRLPNRPWVLTFSFARALQTSALYIWQGKQENEKAAQNEMLKLAKFSGLASLGKYTGGLTTASGAQATFVAEKY